MQKCIFGFYGVALRHRTYQFLWFYIYKALLINNKCCLLTCSQDLSYSGVGKKRDSGNKVTLKDGSPV